MCIKCSQVVDSKDGEMSEWLKEHAWKACVGETLPWVRIPLSPPIPPRLEIASGDIGVDVPARHADASSRARDCSPVSSIGNSPARTSAPTLAGHSHQAPFVNDSRSPAGS